MTFVGIMHTQSIVWHTCYTIRPNRIQLTITYKPFNKFHHISREAKRLFSLSINIENGEYNSSSVETCGINV